MPAPIEAFGEQVAHAGPAERRELRVDLAVGEHAGLVDRQREQELEPVVAARAGGHEESRTRDLTGCRRLVSGDHVVHVVVDVVRGQVHVVAGEREAVALVERQVRASERSGGEVGELAHDAIAAQ